MVTCHQSVTGREERGENGFKQGRLLHPSIQISSLIPILSGDWSFLSDQEIKNVTKVQENDVKTDVCLKDFV